MARFGIRRPSLRRASTLDSPPRSNTNPNSNNPSGHPWLRRGRTDLSLSDSDGSFSGSDGYDSGPDNHSDHTLVPRNTNTRQNEDEDDDDEDEILRQALEENLRLNKQHQQGLEAQQRVHEEMEREVLKKSAAAAAKMRKREEDTVAEEDEQLRLALEQSERDEKERARKRKEERRRVKRMEREFGAGNGNGGAANRADAGTRGGSAGTGTGAGAGETGSSTSRTGRRRAATVGSSSSSNNRDGIRSTPQAEPERPRRRRERSEVSSPAPAPAPALTPTPSTPTSTSTRAPRPRRHRPALEPVHEDHNQPHRHSPPFQIPPSPPPPSTTTQTTTQTRTRTRTRTNSLPQPHRQPQPQPEPVLLPLPPHAPTFPPPTTGQGLGVDITSYSLDDILARSRTQSFPTGPFTEDGLEFNHDELQAAINASAEQHRDEDEEAVQRSAGIPTYEEACAAQKYRAPEGSRYVFQGPSSVTVEEGEGERKLEVVGEMDLGEAMRVANRGRA